MSDSPNQEIAGLNPIVNDNGTIAFIGVDYEEFKPESFRGYFVQINDDKVSGYGTHAEATAFAQSKADRVFNLSSVDHYETDKKKPRIYLVEG